MPVADMPVADVPVADMPVADVPVADAPPHLPLYWTFSIFPGAVSQSMISDQELNRMRWASRRGMLELDLVLEPFVNARYRSLGEADRRRFQRLMECEDQDLFAWFLRRERPADEELAGIVQQILEFSRARPDGGTL